MIQFFTNTPSHYPPKCIDEVDFGFDEAHPWQRAFRQEKPMIKVAGGMTLFFSLIAYANPTVLSVGGTVLLAIFFVWAFLDEKRNCEKFGHLRPNYTGDYWRARKLWLQRKSKVN